jgi:hypothetical protein
MRRCLVASWGALSAIGWVSLALAQAPQAASSPPGPASQGQVVSTPLPFGAATANNNNNSNAFTTPPGSTKAPKVSPPRVSDGAK